jgi:hypothetical protein
MYPPILGGHTNEDVNDRLLETIVRLQLELER